jgi:hypothetical protein
MLNVIMLSVLAPLIGLLGYKKHDLFLPFKTSLVGQESFSVMSFSPKVMEL